ncbi:hypothetical protein L6R52_00900 [Myxococcota bacterium]|nr:hypothetical protein [Myxococcota bacterium]
MRRLSDDFVPVVGAHEVLTAGPLASWWSAVVAAANRQHRGGTTQGYYVFASDGTPVVWDNYIPRIPMFLERAYAMALHAHGGRIPVPADVAARAAPPKAPEDVSVVRLFTRITPLPPGADRFNALLGRDSMWILGDEVRVMIEASSEVGVSFDLPPNLARRLVTFHLVDNVRGAVWPWRPSAVTKDVLRAKVLERSQDRLRLELSGAFEKEDSHPPQWTSRGQRGTLEGELVLDVKTAKVLRLRAIARSTAWSDATYESYSRPPKGDYPIVTALVEANDALARDVAPEAARFGHGYLAPRTRR